MEDGTIVYLDYNAATPPDPMVVKVIKRSLEEHWGNPSSSYQKGLIARSVVDKSREQVAKMLNVNKEEIVFVSGGTEANNLVLHSVSKFQRKDNSIKAHIITTNVEHDSIKNYLSMLQIDGNVEVSWVNVDATGCLSVEDIISQIKRNTCLITVMHANNETGIIMPIQNIGIALKDINASRLTKNLPKVWFHTDAAQTIGKIIVDVKELGVDYLTVVGSKFYGPRIGALYAKNLNIADDSAPIIPMLIGGGQEHCFRSGTENTPMIAGLGIAAELVTRNLGKYNTDMKHFRGLLATEIEKIPGFVINFQNVPNLPNTLSVQVPKNLTAQHVLENCNGKLCMSLGAACHSGSGKPSGVLIACGLSQDEAVRTLRISVGRMTSVNDIALAAKLLEKACNFV